MGEVLVHIYELRDPDTDRPRYVGRTRRRFPSPEESLAHRLYEHLHEGRFASKKKAAWVESMLERGLKPTIHLLETVPELEAGTVEWGWISKHLLNGEELVNIAGVRAAKTSDRTCLLSEKTHLMMLVEREFGGVDIRDLLTAWSDEGLGYFGMAARIRSKDIKISRMAIAKWVRQLGGRWRIVFPGGPYRRDS